MREYHKIYGPFKRHTSGPDKNRLIIGEWSRPEFEVVQYINWTWTEKLDGTNVRVEWDGHRVEFAGRTDKAQLPNNLLAHLGEVFTEEMFEQIFGGDQVILFGEGVGPKIQKNGGMYGPQQHFVLFDVFVGDKWWLQHDDIAGVADGFDITVAPIRLVDNVWNAIEEVSLGLASRFSEVHELAEGLVGVPRAGLRNRAGERIVMKVKTVDFHKEK